MLNSNPCFAPNLKTKNSVSHKQMWLMSVVGLAGNLSILNANGLCLLRSWPGTVAVVQYACHTGMRTWVWTFNIHIRLGTVACICNFCIGMRVDRFPGFSDLSVSSPLVFFLRVLITVRCSSLSSSGLHLPYVWWSWIARQEIIQSRDCESLIHSHCSCWPAEMHFHFSDLSSSAFWRQYFDLLPSLKGSD